MNLFQSGGRSESFARKENLKFYNNNNKKDANCVQNREK
jgi:hypothetical protein